MRIRIAKVTALNIFAACCRLALGQAPPTILTIDVENFVIYQADTSDSTMWGTVPDPTPSLLTTSNNFFVETLFADIVAVNGQPAKGLYAARGQTVKTNPNPAPASAIADVTHLSMRQMIFEILKPDGTKIGSIIALGMSNGATPPGSPAAQVNGNWAIVGGTGAFLGARGQIGPGQGGLPGRTASMREDPSKRRANGGGGSQPWIVTLIPMVVPQILTTTNGPAVVHAGDGTLVTAEKPARAGEILSLFGSGLGPTRPGVDPGQPFPASPLQVVNSPVQVLVNGKPGDALYAGGYPGAADGYQVNFRIPDGITPGQTSLQLSSAWIVGPAVNIPVQ